MKNNRIRLLLALMLPLLANVTGRSQTLPPVSDPGYNAAKSALVPTSLVPPELYVRHTTSSLSWADGCFVNPDETYTELPGNDDGSTGFISLPFTFTLYGTSYTGLYVNNNGNITFGSTLSTFSASGFPISTAMIAPFWADVDTRVGNTVKYKVEDHRFTATWPGVGYYPTSIDKIDSFQVIITDGTDAEIGIGNNVAFRYGQMNWTTGSASGGSGGFGGTPATVGVNAGDGVNYVQIGRFNENSSDYVDNTSNSGVHYLEYNCFAIAAADTGNIPPSVSGLPLGRRDTINCGETQSYYLNWVGPEVGQLTSSTVTLSSSICSTTVADPSGFFSISKDTITITGASCNVGTHYVYLEGVDNIGAVTHDTITVVIVPLSVSASNSGPVCAGNTLSLNVTSPGAGATYSWSGPGGFSSTMQNPSISGVTAAGSGTYTVTVTTSGGCSATATTSATVTSSSITGTATLCTGGTTSLTGDGSGSWSSSNTAVATVSGSGVVSGLTAGTSTISFLSSTGCLATRVVTVNASPGISGATSLCEGLTTVLTGSGTGVSWSSSNPSVATIGVTSGLVTALNAGTTSITFTSSAGSGSTCNSVVEFTVYPAVGSIGGSSSVCAGSTLSVSVESECGSWSSSTPAVATVSGGTPTVSGGSGTVTGVAAGTANITFTSCDGCISVKTITVNPTPVSISGTTTICLGSTSTLSCATPGGSWSSGNTSVATVSGSGVVSGVGTGTATIYYTNSAGCSSSTVVTIGSGAGSISGSSSVCVGSTTTLTSPVGGGSWSSGNTSIATVSPSGVVSGVSAGSVGITYSTAGCQYVQMMLVNDLPGAISGSSSVCVSGTTMLSSSTGGGSWSSSNGSVATVDGSGMVTGISSGSVVITYSTGSGCYVTKSMVVNALPSAITGSLSLCTGSTSSLSSATSGGGAWSSSNTDVASVGVSSGVVSGVSAGTASITFTSTSGCSVKVIVTVNSAAGSISGSSTVCAGSSSSLSVSAGCGSWSSSNTAIATISGDETITGAAPGSTGTLTGVGAGTATISFTTCDGCVSTRVVTVNASPASISGTSSMCVGSSVMMTSATPGGTWSSDNASVAMASGSGGTGTVTGMGTGTATIIYTNASGCSTSHVVSVGSGPGSNSGDAVVCAGQTTTLSNSTGGGTWSSSNTLVATVGASTGVVNGATAGTANITYMVGAGCYAVTTVTVNGSMGAISGSSSVCAGSTTTLSHATGGGTWSSSNETIATVASSTGVVSGVSAGSVTITYMISSGCYRTKSMVVNAGATISGTPSVCAGSSTSLSVSVSGGAWSSSTTAVGTINGGGVFGGLTAGTTTLSYTVSGCTTTVTGTVNALPDAIGGTASVCAGSVTTLSSSPSGGTWASVNTSVATVDGSGNVSGVSSGTSLISYVLSTGCKRTKVVTVNALPGVITGNLGICGGGTSTLSSSPSGGTWSGSSAVASISSSGVVTGLTSGTVTVSYTNSAGCVRTAVVTVSTGLSANTGDAVVCAGQTTMLSNSTGGGTWSSSNTSKATVNSSTGVVSGVTSGTANITYMVGAGCYAVTTVTVNGALGAITGTTSVCVGSSTTLSHATGGGTWSSASGNVSVSSGTGVVTGVSAGTAMITYTVSSGCTKTIVVTVTALPVISGSPSVCAGSSTAVTATPSGGAWSSSNTAVGTINGGGVFGGLTVGTTTLSYTALGCSATATGTVTSGPAAIGGAGSVCIGSTLTLTNATGGGTWSSASGNVSVSSGTGEVTGVSAGTAMVTYSIGSCTATAVVTVAATPTISGSLSTCEGNTANLTGSPSGGTWSSSTAGVGTISSTGVVTGISSGTTTITYTTGTGCAGTAVFTVNAVPGAISGSSSMCIGGSATFTNATAGGTWSTSSSAILSIVSGTGVATAAGPGVATVTYTVGGCTSTTSVTVTSTPGAISGSSNMCAGQTSAYTHGTPGGTWSSSNGTIATIDETTGVATGVAAGAVTFTYHLSGACFATISVSVSGGGTPITGTASVCVGSTTVLSASYGAWSSANDAVGTIGSASGVVGGISAGTVNMTFTGSGGCVSVTVVTVNPVPTAIAGTFEVCQSATTTLTSTPGGGTWSSSNVTKATVGAGTGIVTGVNPGTAIITYAFGSCSVSQAVTINSLPTLPAIVGAGGVHPGSPVTVTAAYGQVGEWTSGDVSRATVAFGPSNTSTVTAVSAGTVWITFTTYNACGSRFRRRQFTIFASRPAGGVATGTEQQIRMYPNPTNGSFNVETSVSGVFTMFTIDGRKVMTEAVTSGTTVLRVPANLSKGIYMCRFEGEDGSSELMKLTYDTN